MATQIVHSLFDNGPKICKDCHRMLPKDCTDEVCPACKERELFSKVKDFIRENDVTEFDVADHFEIPLHKVKSWIREGRIQYKELHTPTIESLHCQQCGEPIAFGTLCPKCQRKLSSSGSVTIPSSSHDNRFRYL